MMSLDEFVKAAKEVDDLDIPEIIKRYPVLQSSFWFENERFPDYPTVPYKQLHPDASLEEIFKQRVFPQLYTFMYVYDHYRDYVIPAVYGIFSPNIGSA